VTGAAFDVPLCEPVPFALVPPELGYEEPIDEMSTGFPAPE
jgi:hypothetical protein